MRWRDETWRASIGRSVAAGLGVVLALTLLAGLRRGWDILSEPALWIVNSIILAGVVVCTILLKVVMKALA
jgi:hypothetical protein